MDAAVVAAAATRSWHCGHGRDAGGCDSKDWHNHNVAEDSGYCYCCTEEHVDDVVAAGMLGSYSLQFAAAEERDSLPD